MDKSLLVILAAAVGFTLAYGTIRTAQRIAKTQITSVQRAPAGLELDQ